MAGRSVIAITADTKDAEQKLKMLEAQSKSTFDAIANSTSKIIEKDREYQKVLSQLMIEQKKLNALNKSDSGYAAQAKRVKELSESAKKYRKELQLLNQQQASMKRENRLIDQQIKAQKNLTKTITETGQAEKKAESYRSGSLNTTVRYIRALESLIVGLYSLKQVYDVTIGVGHEYNKLMEELQIGLGAIFMQYVNGKDAVEKFANAQLLAKQQMESIREINVQTPHDLAGTLKIYKALSGQVLQYGGNLKQLGELTKRVSIVGASYGVQLENIVKTVDSLVAGKMLPSDMQRALSAFGVSQKALRDLAKSGGDVMGYLEKKLKDVDAVGKSLEKSWGGVTSKFINIYKEIAAELDKPLFDTWKEEILEIADLLSKNKDDIISGFKQIGDAAIELAKVLTMYFGGKMVMRVVALAKNLSSVRLAVYGAATALLSLLPQVEAKLEGLPKYLTYFQMGLVGIQYAFFSVVSGIGSGINKIGEYWHNLTESMKKWFFDSIDSINNRFDIMVNQVAGVFGKTFKSGYKPYNYQKEAYSGEDLGIDTSWSTQNRDESALKFMELMKQLTGEKKKQTKEDEKQVKLAKIKHNASNEEVKNSKAAARLADKIAKEQMRMLEEQMKQELLRFKIAQKTSLTEWTLQSDKLKATELEVKQSEKLIEASKKLLKGSKSQLELEKLRTKQLQNQLKLVEAQGAEVNKWQGVFESLLKGDFKGATNSVFGGLFDKLKTQTADLFGGLSSLGGQITGGFAGFGIGTGLNMLFQGLFGDKEQTPPELPELLNVSDSMANSLELIKDVQYPLLDYTKQMTESLRIIANSFAGLENKLIVSGVDLGGKLFQDTYKKGTLFGGKSTELYGMLLDVGTLTAEGLTNAMLTTVTKTVSTTWYGRKKTYYNKQFEDIGDLMANFLEDAYKESLETIFSTTDKLKLDIPSDVEIAIDLPEFDITDMSNSEVSQMIQQAFNAEMDRISREVYGNALDVFQRAGEGLAETAARVGTVFDQVGYQLGNLGKAVTWQSANYMADYAGGLETLNSAVATYVDTYYSDTEKMDLLNKELSDSFKKLNLTMPKSKTEFRGLVDSIDTTTKAGAELYVELINLSGKFDDLQGSMKNTATVMDDIINAWLGQYSYLTMMQKTQLATAYFGQQRSVASAENMVQQAWNSTTTKEEYIPYFEKYILQMQNEAEPATLNDVVSKLDEVKAAVESASYQESIATGAYYGT